MYNYNVLIHTYTCVFICKYVCMPNKINISSKYFLVAIIIHLTTTKNLFCVFFLWSYMVSSILYSDSKYLIQSIVLIVYSQGDLLCTVNVKWNIYSF